MNTFDNLSCEEVFELNAVCDEWQNDAIEAQEQELAERKRKMAVEMFWFIFNRRQQGDWDWKKAKKKLAIILNCAILNPVSERNTMTYPIINMNSEIEHDGHEVTCCGCGAEVVISEEEVGQWDHGLENFQCWECE